MYVGGREDCVFLGGKRHMGGHGWEACDFSPWMEEEWVWVKTEQTVKRWRKGWDVSGHRVCIGIWKSGFSQGPGSPPFTEALGLSLEEGESPS